MYLSRRSGRTCDKSRSQNALFLLQRLGRDGFMDGDRALATRFDQSPSFVCLCQVSSQRTGIGPAYPLSVWLISIRLMRNLLGLLIHHNYCPSPENGENLKVYTLVLLYFMVEIINGRSLTAPMSWAVRLPPSSTSTAFSSEESQRVGCFQR